MGCGAAVRIVAELEGRVCGTRAVGTGKDPAAYSFAVGRVGELKAEAGGIDGDLPLVPRHIPIQLGMGLPIVRPGEPVDHVEGVVADHIGHLGAGADIDLRVSDSDTQVRTFLSEFGCLPVAVTVGDAHAGDEHSPRHALAGFVVDGDEPKDAVAVFGKGDGDALLHVHAAVPMKLHPDVEEVDHERFRSGEASANKSNERDENTAHIGSRRPGSVECRVCWRS